MATSGAVIAPPLPGRGGGGGGALRSRDAWQRAVAALAARVLRLLEACSAPELANAAWALAALSKNRHHDIDGGGLQLLGKIADVAGWLLGEFNPQDLLLTWGAEVGLQCDASGRFILSQPWRSGATQRVCSPLGGYH